MMTQSADSTGPLAEPVKWPVRVEWEEENESVGVYVDDDDEAMLMTAQEGVSVVQGWAESRTPYDFPRLIARVYSLAGKLH